MEQWILVIGRKDLQSTQLHDICLGKCNLAFVAILEDALQIHFINWGNNIYVRLSEGLLPITGAFLESSMEIQLSFNIFSKCAKLSKGGD